MPFAYFSILSTAIALTNEYSKLLASISAVGVTVGAWFFTDYFIFYTPYSFILSALVLLTYLFLPDKYAEKIRLALKIYRSDNIGRYSINLTRSILSGQLFEMSAVFDEMSNSMQKLKMRLPDDQILIEKGCDEIFMKVCAVCPSAHKCKTLSYSKAFNDCSLIFINLS